MRRIAVTVALSCAAAFVASVAPIAHAAPGCFGHPATIVGTSGHDELVGTEGRDVIVGRGGEDRISARGGRDLICGGALTDFVEGGAGNDRIKGGTGDDFVKSGPGDDRVWTGPGSQEGLFGGPGNDRLFGGPGERDGFLGGPGDDLMDGGRGSDVAEFFDSPQGVVVDLAGDTATGHGTDRLVSIEGAGGSNHDDVLLGDEGSNLLVGQEGDDTIRAFGSGEEGELLVGGAGRNVIDGGQGPDFVTYDDSPAPIHADLSEGVATGWGSDTLEGIESLIGSDFDDSFVGDDGNNRIAGGFGDDLLDGGAGIDEVSYFDSFEPVAIDLAQGSATGWGTDRVEGFEDVWGSSFDDTLSGDAAANTIFGSGGRDSIFGVAGDDNLVGGRGEDVADGGAGTDTCDVETEVACELHPPSEARHDLMPTTTWLPYPAATYPRRGSP